MNTNDVTMAETTEGIVTTEELIPPCEEHDFALTQTVAARALAAGSHNYTCKICGSTKSEEIPATDRVSVLAIGNSFTQDSMQYLWELCNTAGISTVELGYLYIGGSGLENDMANIQSGTKAYTYYKNTEGTWSTTQSSIAQALADNDWEIVVLRHHSIKSADPSSFAPLNSIISFIEEKKPETKLYWHSTWAYDQDYIDRNFADIVGDQERMYQLIVDTVQNVVLETGKFERVIPSTMAIQNMRTFYLADKMTRDGYHLSLDIGRYVAGLTWFCAITGGTPDATDYVPVLNRQIKLHFPAIREAVANAIANPFEVTKSGYPTN